jgi:hypothetical protein
MRIDCICTVSAVVTLRNMVGDSESSSFGGVIFARADNDNIHTIHDVSNRIVIASSIYEMGSGPMQWEGMRTSGEDLLFAPSQARLIAEPRSTLLSLERQRC